jgi:dolichol kinase
MALRREEVTRKLLHVIFGALIPAGIIYIPMFVQKYQWPPLPIDPRIYPVMILALCLLFFVVIEFLRLRVPAVQNLFHSWFGHMLRLEETKRTTGATYINASALLCSLIFFQRPYISAIVLSLFIWGDAVAALVGQSIGRIKIGKKSLEGSIACFVLCLLMFFFIFPYIPQLDVWGGRIPLALILIASLSTTLLELFPMRVTKHITINDNLIVPVITGVIMLVFFPPLQ